MKAAQTFGLLLLVLGLFLSLIGYTINSAGIIMRVFFAGPILFLLGVTMIIVPGSNYTNKDLRIGGVLAKDVISKASKNAKRAWIISIILGMIISFIFR